MRYKKIIGAAMAALMVIAPVVSEQDVLAKTLYVKENEEITQVEATTVSVKVDGVSQKDETMQGIMYENSCMLPCSLLQTVLNINVKVEDATIQLQKYDQTIQLQIGSKTAVVNGKEITMSKEPLINKTDEKEEVYVPMEFILGEFHYNTELIKESEETYHVDIQSPLVYSEEKGECYYNGDCIWDLSIDGKAVSLTDAMPGIEQNGVMVLPLKESFANKTVGASVVTSGSSIVVKRGSHTVEIATNSSIAIVNGTEKQMDTAVKAVKYKEKEYLLVPAEFLFLNLGAKSVETDRSAKKMIVSGLTTNNTVDKSKNYVKKVKISKLSKVDSIILTCKKTPKFQVKSSSTQIKITLKNVAVEKNETRKLKTNRNTSSFSIKQSGKNVVVVLKKKKGVSYITQYGSGKVCIYVGIKPVRITVDCGHGANTPGKRTPKMPCNIDFDGDGKIDVKKGHSIKEHQANVGVGRELANELERLGFKVNRYAFGSSDPSLSSRQRSIRSFHSKYSISVHFNAAGSGRMFNRANGVEVYYHSKYPGKASKGLAKSVLSQMAKGTKQTNRGVRSQILALCNTKSTRADASILVECAFMTNLREAKTMVGSKKFWKETGAEIAKGVCNYAGLPYVAK